MGMMDKQQQRPGLAQWSAKEKELLDEA